MPNQGFLAITFFETISFSILLILYFILDRGRPARFFTYWLIGWATQTICAGLLMFSVSVPGTAIRLIAQEAQIAGLAFFLVSICSYTGRKVRPAILWPAMALGAIALAAAETHPTVLNFDPRWIGFILQSSLWIVSGWLLWRFAVSKTGYGARLLAATMFLAGLHGVDAMFWRDQPSFLLRVAFQDFFNVAIGIAMAVLIIEARDLRAEDLDVKLRRLTLITAASTQSLNVDQMLGIVLHHMVESLNASHGLVRLITGTGEAAELIIRSAIGYSDTYLLKHEKMSTQIRWVRKALSQEQPFTSLEGEDGPEDWAQPPHEQLSSAILVRLPGPDAALGWIVVGSREKRKFYPEEITFLTNVANLLGLTVQSLRLFEQVATVQRQWANTFDSIDDPILVHDSAGLIIRVNQSFAARSGWKMEDMEGRSVPDILKKSGDTWNHCPYCENVAGKGNDIDAALGGFILASNSQFHDADDQPLGIIHVLQDVTARRRAEQRYQILIENIREGVFMATPENRLLDFNQAFLNMLGYEDREELMQVEDIGNLIYVNPVDRDRLMMLLQANNSVSNFEFQIRRKDGEIRTLLESSFVTRGTSGVITAYQGFVLDITERKQAEQEIRRRNRELLVLNAIGLTLNQPIELDEMLHRALGQVVELFGTDQGAIYLLDRDTHAISRPAACGMQSEFARHFPEAAFPADLLEDIRTSRATILSQPDMPLPAVFCDVQRAEGIRASLMLVLWSRSQPIGLLSLGQLSPREFSPVELNLLATVGNQIAVAVEKIQLYEETRAAYENLRRTQEQLLQSEKMGAVGQLISGVAHELNNPLTAILGYGELLASGHFLNAQGAEYVGKIYKQAQRTHRIVHNLLSFARQHKPERVPVQLNQILEDTLALREYDLRANNIVVYREFAEDLPTISADAHQLQQVFLNMLNNALDAVLEGPNRGELWLRTARDPAAQRVIVEFIDNGPGVAELPKVFDPFYTTKPVGKGTGLGLSICYGIVTEHGGEITARNVPPRGACFTIQFPILTAQDRTPFGNQQDDKSNGRCRILLVDSEDAVLDLERESLRPHHRSVYAVRNAREAARLLEFERFDLIVSEWREKGDFAGPEFYDWICKFWPELATHIVFVISGTGEVDSAPARIRQSCLFLRKPFQVDELLAAVQQALREKLTSPVKL